MNKKIVFIAGLFIALVLIGNVLAALNVKIGSGIMILRAETGDEIERSILVINDNDFPVNIELTASGDLAEDITIKDDNFTLQAGEKKKAFFTIYVKRAGKTESRVNVQFTPIDGKNRGVLSSKITVVAAGEDVNVDENVDENTETEDNSSKKSVSGSITGNIVVGKINKNIIAFGTTLILALVFIVILIIYYIKFKKKTKESEETKKEVKTK